MFTHFFFGIKNSKHNVVWALSLQKKEKNKSGFVHFIAEERKPKADKKKGEVKRRKNAKINDNDEAVEESDEGDFDDRELDYISDSGRLAEYEA